MATTEVAVARVEEGAAKCRHHWIIETPRGPTSKGVCRLCGSERRFDNYVEGGPWVDESTALGASRRVLFARQVSRPEGEEEA